MYETLVANLIGGVRYEKRGGRKYLVAPLSLIVPGILNGSHGPLLYPPDQVVDRPAKWNRTPLLAYHPYTSNGEPASARTEGVYARQGIGYIDNAEAQPKKGSRLAAEGWFDIERTKRVNADIYNRLRRGEKIELSTGLGTSKVPVKPGATWNGQPYVAIARDYTPDHVAVLPDQVGACSIRDGCGVLVNSNPEGINQWTTGMGHAVSHEGFSQKDRKEASKATVKEAHKALTEAGYSKGDSDRKVQAATKFRCLLALWRGFSIPRKPLMSTQAEKRLA